MAGIDDSAVIRRLHDLMADYADEKKLVEEGMEAMRQIREEIADLAGDRDVPPLEMADCLVTYTVRSANRKPNVVKLINLGIPVENFSTVNPTLGAYQAMAKRLKWPESYTDQFIVESGEKVPSLKITKRDVEEDIDE